MQIFTKVGEVFN